MSMFYYVLLGPMHVWVCMYSTFFPSSTVVAVVALIFNKRRHYIPYSESVSVLDPVLDPVPDPVPDFQRLIFSSRVSGGIKTTTKRY